MRRVLDLPLIVILMGIGAMMMFVPVFHAVIVRDWHEARAFFYSGLFFCFLTGFLAIATVTYKPRSLARSHLTAMLAAFLVLPVMLAVPFYEAVRDTTFLNAWFEMVSSVTTTGATLFEPSRLSDTVHLWRALVGWAGGFLIWVTAVAILAPMNLGGFEVTSQAKIGVGAFTEGRERQKGRGDARDRLARYSMRLLPIYVGLTAVLWVALVVVGERPLVGACHAMSVLATSGISPVGGLGNANAGLAGEALIFLFFIFAITRVAISTDMTPYTIRRLHNDPEARIGVFLIILVPSFLFLRHWVGAYEVSSEADVQSAVWALWGSVFSVASFLTTTGFVSFEWSTAGFWSGLETPGMILLGLALIGGGVATTAGGVKLLRVYALYQHGKREMERLVHPSSIGSSGVQGRQMRRQGAYVAWIFFMLFAISLALVSMALTVTGVPFDQAMVLAAAAQSTTGPAAAVVLETPISYAALNDVAKYILAAAMVLGRLETLAIIALMNPEFWRS